MKANQTRPSERNRSAKPGLAPASKRESATGFRKIYLRCKAASDGGLLLFEFHRVQTAASQTVSTEKLFTVFFEDAETAGEIIGVYPTSSHPDGPVQIFLTQSQINRNMRLLRAAGQEDIWIVGKSGSMSPADPYAHVDALTRYHIEALNRAA